MKKSAKIISIVMALMLTIGIVQVAFISASAKVGERVIKSAELIYEGEDYNSDMSYSYLFENSYVEIVFENDGMSTDDTADDEAPEIFNFIYEDLQNISIFNGNETYRIEDFLFDNDYCEMSIYDDSGNKLAYVNHWFEAFEPIDTDTKPVICIELVKLPEKVFTSPLNYNDIWMKDNKMEYFEKNRENYISENMKGAVVAVTFNDGTVKNYTFDTSCYLYGGAGFTAYRIDEQIFYIKDLGDYKAELGYGTGASEIPENLIVEFTVNHVNSDSEFVPGSTSNPSSSAGSSTADTAISSTSDTATSDTVSSNANGTNDSNAIKTGSTVPAIMIVVLAAACSVLAFFRKRRNFDTVW